MNTLAAAHAAADATPDEITQARAWVRDVVANPDTVDDAPATDVIAYLDRQYATGWAGFLNDFEDPS